jgi:hypothetical protein
MDNGFRKTLNKKGDHFSNLGIVENEFNEFLLTLDQNPDVAKPAVAIPGAAFALIAAKGLKLTERVTFFLNDLDERHFEEIKRWSKETPYENRLVFAPGSFLKMHENEDVKAFFKDSEVQFHGTLAANLFHHLTPEEYIKGLGFLSDRAGEAFLMTACLPLDDQSKRYGEQAIVKALKAYEQLIDLYGSEQAIALFKQFSGKGYDGVNGLIIEVQKRQYSILYNYHKDHGVPFPGYFLNDHGILNPFLFRISKSNAGASASCSYFYTTPEELKAWSQIVGLDCQKIRCLDVNTRTNSVLESEEGQYLYARLRKNTSASAGEYADKGAYQDLLTRAQNIDADLQRLGRGKFFELGDEAPHIGITDTKTGNRYPADAEVTEAHKAATNARVLSQYYKELEAGNSEAYLALATTYYSMQDYRMAVFYHVLGVAAGNQQCQHHLDRIKQMGIGGPHYSMEDLQKLFALYWTIAMERQGKLGSSQNSEF